MKALIAAFFLFLAFVAGHYFGWTEAHNACTLTVTYEDGRTHIVPNDHEITFRGVQQCYRVAVTR